MNLPTQILNTTPECEIVSKRTVQVVASFEALDDDKTNIVFKQIFMTEKECNKLKPFVVDKNEENFDRLERVLSEIAD